MNFVESLKKYLSDEQIQQLMDSLNLEEKHAVLLNLRKMDDETFLKLFPNVIKHPIVPHAYLYKKIDYELGKSIYHDLGCFYLQEPAAMTVAYLLNPKEGETVLDMCAAPGGKSIQSSFLMNNKGLIVSNDLSRSRVNAIIENEERLGIGNIIVTNNDLNKIYQKHLEQFDKIILDAPCSGSGMFRKDQAVKDDWSYNKVIKFQEIQKELILIAYQMLKPGGTLSYSTCSFSKEEDEDVVKYLLDHTNAELIKLDNPLFFIYKEEPLGFHLLPSIFPGEGHYICLIKKPGVSIISKEKDKNKKDNKLKSSQFEFNTVYKYGDYLFGINQETNLKDFNIIRMGVKIGEQIKDNVRFDYHYSHYINAFKQVYELSEAELKTYFSGDILRNKLPRGYTLLKYQGINVDIAKSDGNSIKNNLPKALRKHF